MSVAVMTIVWKRSKSDSADLLLLLAIADVADDDGVAFFTQEKLALKTRSRRETVNRAVNRLVQAGELEVRKARKGRKTVNIYRVVINRSALVPVDYERLPFELLEPFSDDVTPTHMVPAEHVTREATPWFPPSPSPPTPPPPPPTLTPGAHAPAYTREASNAVWDALVAATGISPESKPERSRFGKCVKELLSLGATPDEIKARARRWSMKYPSASLTDTTLVNRWGELGEARGLLTGGKKCDHPGCGLTVPNLTAHRYQSHGIGEVCLDCGDVYEGTHNCKLKEAQ